MTAIDPRWHSTDHDSPDEGEPVPVRITRPSSPSAPRIVGVSRMPAAVVGILLVLGAGFYAVRGWDGFQGQLTGSGSSASKGPDITISDTGVTPAAVQVTAGNSVIFHNNTAIPHILQSDTLKDTNGKTLYTPAIFPSTRYTFMVSADQPSGEYAFASITDPAIKGTITVIGTAVASSAAASSTDSSTDTESASSSSETAIISESSSSEAETIVQAAASSSDSSEAQDTADLIPYNPFTVAAGRITGRTPLNPSSSTTQTSRSSARGSVLANQGTVHSGPPSQPESGPELWIAVSLSIAAVLVSQRKALGI